MQGYTYSKNLSHAFISQSTYSSSIKSNFMWSQKVKTQNCTFSVVEPQPIGSAQWTHERKMGLKETLYPHSIHIRIFAWFFKHHVNISLDWAHFVCPNKRKWLYWPSVVFCYADLIRPQAPRLGVFPMPAFIVRRVATHANLQLVNRRIFS